ncbi:uncharacterized protein LOC119025642 isoform X3 [Acanthopagrus latus]|uniref:uncharacterized protein LOC119025642 isoform X3 n=1 Tax=Acanthopagrus latus TaxID=8177 RepID=UPI00187C82D4|nr:uncharacterized protein LOC119025642 isoform X3 [Acanthopagrus latus]
MCNPKAKHSCSVVGCTDTQVSLHRLPTNEDIRAKWLNFIFQGNVPASLSKSVVVCANHFTPDCFSNQGQYQAGLATRLSLKDGKRKKEIPSTSVQQSVVHHVACQTDQPVKCTVGTQLSMRTIRPHLRSTGSRVLEPIPILTLRDEQLFTLTLTFCLCLDCASWSIQRASIQAHAPTSSQTQDLLAVGQQR